MLRYGGPAVPSVRLRFSTTSAVARNGFPGPVNQSVCPNLKLDTVNAPKKLSS